MIDEQIYTRRGWTEPWGRIPAQMGIDVGKICHCRHKEAGPRDTGAKVRQAEDE